MKLLLSDWDFLRNLLVERRHDCEKRREELISDDADVSKRWEKAFLRLQYPPEYEDENTKRYAELREEECVIYKILKAIEDHEFEF